MLDAFENKSHLVTFILNEKEEYAALSDDDECKFSVYDTRGNIVADLEDVEVEIDEDKGTVVNIVIPSEANTIEEDKDFSVRFVELNYTIEGVQHSIRKNYRVLPFAKYTVTEDDVRKLIGLPDTILEDSMIDIYYGYIKSKALFNADVLDEALISGTIKSVIANKIIAIKSALELRTTIPLLTPKIETESIVSQTRYTFSLEDFNKLFDDLQDELNALEDELVDEDVLAAYTGDLLLVGNRTDEFTGA